ncbi:MAG: metallopeptidase TldD-related protein [Acidobacteriota bacterium]|nr:metallopeptidase TldD-related protein [Acidobacteriota bacterium]
MREECLSALDAAGRQGWGRAEVFAKRGRSRRFRLGQGMESVHSSEEAGWAVRFGDDRSSGFYTASGMPGGDLALPEPGPGGLRLPGAAATSWRECESVTHPLLSEAEGLEMLRAAQGRLQSEIPESYFCDATVDDGASESCIVSSNGVDVAFRGRAAVLRWEVLGPAPALDRTVVTAAAVSGRELRGEAVVDRAVDVLRIRRDGRPVESLGARIVAVPEVSARLLSASMGAFVGSSREESAQWLGATDGEVGGRHLSLVDDGRLEGGLLSAPVDGEGVPTAARELILNGRLGEPLVAWDVAVGASGCRRRSGWRDRPRVAASHFFLVPDATISPMSLVEDLASGYYFVGSDETLDAKSNRLSLGVYGYEVAHGKPIGPIFGRLAWDPRKLLGKIVAAARDLRFVAMGAMVGAPTLEIDGIDLIPDP